MLWEILPCANTMVIAIRNMTNLYIFMEFKLVDVLNCDINQECNYQYANFGQRTLVMISPISWSRFTLSGPHWACRRWSLLLNGVAVLNGVSRPNNDQTPPDDFQTHTPSLGREGSAPHVCVAANKACWYTGFLKYRLMGGTWGQC